MSWRHPFSKRTITSRYGATANRPSPHRGLDYAPGEKKVIPAVADGEIVFVGWSDCLGWVAVQKCRASNGQIVFVGYCHMRSKVSWYKVGDFRRAGEGIGKVGNTGSCSRGAHLHLTIGPKVDSVFRGTTVNPETFIDQQAARCANCTGCCKKG
jgi:murein DD-endopeptidase MepM/ murein hydrolase activator NlpD